MDGAIAFAALDGRGGPARGVPLPGGQDHGGPVPGGDARVRGDRAAPRPHLRRSRVPDPRGPRAGRSWRRRSASCSRSCGGRPGRCGASRWSGRSRPTSRSTSTRTGCCSWGPASSPTRERLERSLGAPERRLRRVSPWPFDYEELPPRRPSARCSPCARGPSPSRTCWPCPSRARSSLRAVYALLAGGLVDDAPARVAPVPLAPGAALGLEAASRSAAGDGPAARPLPPRPRRRRRTPSGRRAVCSRRASGSGRSRSCRTRPTATPRRAAPAGCSR